MDRRWLALIAGVLAVVGLGGAVGLSMTTDGTYVVPSIAMSPTLSPGEKTFLRTVDGDVNRGDVVLARTPAPARRQRVQLGALDDMLPKDVAEKLAVPAEDQVAFTQALRVVGIGGDHLETRDGKLYVNGKPADEPYVPMGKATGGMNEPVEVPAGHVYLMGDNRTDARDSRVYGPVRLEDIESRLTFRYWPVRQLGGI